MGRVLTNNFSLSYAVQSAFNVFTTAAGDWKLLEPNEVTNFGPTITTVARRPISKIRGARKPTVTDLDAAVEFSADLTLDSFIDFIEGFCFSVAVNKEIRLFPTAVDGTTDSYTIPALVAGAEDKLDFTAGAVSTLVYARGFTSPTNNGLKALDANIAASATSIGVTDTGLVDETVTANTQLAMLDLAGLRVLATSGDLTWNWDAPVAGQATLTSAADVDATGGWASLGVVVGMFIHVGSPDASGVATNAFQNSVAHDMYGWARVIGVTNDTLTLDKVDAALQFDDATAPATDVDILFGMFVRPVNSDSAEYIEKVFIFEGAWPNLFETDPPTPVANPDGFEYVLNAYCNAFTWEMPLTDKSTASFSFVATNSEPPVSGAAGQLRRTGADTPLEPVQTAALNTSSDITRLRITDVDEAGLTTDFKNLSVSINNNDSPEKVLGLLGARAVNIGDLIITIEGNILFTSAAVIARVRNNTTVTMEMIVKTDDGAIVTDIPSMSLGNGGRELPVNESVQVALTGEAFIDATLGTVIGISILPIVV